MNKDYIDNLSPRSADMVKRGPAVDLLTMILQTGGTFSKIDSAEAQAHFVDLVISNGPTNIDNAGGAGTEILRASQLQNSSRQPLAKCDLFIGPVRARASILPSRR